MSLVKCQNDLYFRTEGVDRRSSSEPSLEVLIYRDGLCFCLLLEIVAIFRDG